MNWNHKKLTKIHIAFGIKIYFTLFDPMSLSLLISSTMFMVTARPSEISIKGPDHVQHTLGSRWQRARWAKSAFKWTGVTTWFFFCKPRCTLTKDALDVRPRGIEGVCVLCFEWKHIMQTDRNEHANRSVHANAAAVHRSTCINTTHAPQHINERVVAVFVMWV